MSYKWIRGSPSSSWRRGGRMGPSGMSIKTLRREVEVADLRIDTLQWKWFIRSVAKGIGFPHSYTENTELNLYIIAETHLLLRITPSLLITPFKKQKWFKCMEWWSNNCHLNEKQVSIKSWLVLLELQTLKLLYLVSLKERKLTRVRWTIFCDTLDMI